MYYIDKLNGNILEEPQQLINKANEEKLKEQQLEEKEQEKLRKENEKKVKETNKIKNNNNEYYSNTKTEQTPYYDWTTERWSSKFHDYYNNGNPNYNTTNKEWKTINNKN